MREINHAIDEADAFVKMMDGITGREQKAQGEETRAQRRERMRLEKKAARKLSRVPR